VHAAPLSAHYYYTMDVPRYEAGGSALERMALRLYGLLALKCIVASSIDERGTESVDSSRPGGKSPHENTGWVRCDRCSSNPGVRYSLDGDVDGRRLCGLFAPRQECTGAPPSASISACFSAGD
jgi:hypothetical protein